MELIQTEEQLKQNVKQFNSYWYDPLYVKDYLAFLKKGRTFVVWKTGGEYLFGPSRIVGYIGNDVKQQIKNKNEGVYIDGRVTNKQITSVLNQDYAYSEELDQLFQAICHDMGVEPENHTRSYWFLESIDADVDKEEWTDGFSEGTEKTSMQKSRTKQEKFRKNLLSYWKGCALSGFTNGALLRASHIKPWHVCNDEERVDRYNGLLLLPTYDELFDRGFISFTSHGDIMISKTLTAKERKHLGLSSSLSITVEEEHKPYLCFHRKFHGFDHSEDD
ncbi:HNH endonuclease [Salibacterium qingdaonense]|nr:HNH endonuclease signature motif containing protein [Salibacterium qingdaonense]